jgi:hypothetical protein
MWSWPALQDLPNHFDILPSRDDGVDQVNLETDHRQRQQHREDSRT